MSIVFIDGFENYGPNGTSGQTLEDRMQQHWDNANVTSQASDTTIQDGRAGMGKSLFWGTQNHWFTKFVPPSQTYFIGFNYFVPSKLTEGGQIIETFASGLYQFRLAAWNDGTLKVYRYTTVVGSTLPNVLRPNTWNHIELRLFCANVGSYEIRVNDINVLSDPSVDLQNGAYNLIDTIQFPAGYGGGQIGDIYLATGAGGQDFMGALKAETIRPDADTAQVDWTPSTGSDHYALVDEVYPDDSDYVSSSTPGDKDLYDFGNLTAIQSGVKAVQISTLAMVSQATPKDLIPVVKSNTTEQDGATHRVSGLTSKQYFDIWEQDPDTAVDWTTTGVNAIQAGVKAG